MISSSCIIIIINIIIIIIIAITIIVIIIIIIIIIVKFCVVYFADAACHELDGGGVAQARQDLWGTPTGSCPTGSRRKGRAIPPTPKLLHIISCFLATTPFFYASEDPETVRRLGGSQRRRVLEDGICVHVYMYVHIYIYTYMYIYIYMYMYSNLY